MDSRPIGIFDSGVGGLTVVKEVMRILPNERIVYFGDMARVPYGTKSKETVTKYSSQIIRFLCTCDVKAIIVACNTVSSNCVERLRADFPDLPIVEVVTPGVAMAASATKNGNIGVIGTQATVTSEKYRDLLLQVNPNFHIFSKACTLFVPLVEEGWADTDIARQTAEIYLKPLLHKNIDTLILGCTHYPLLTETLRKVVGNNIALINPAEEASRTIVNILAKYDLFADGATDISTDKLKRNEHPKPQHTYYVSDSAERFAKLAGIFLGQSIAAVSTIRIENY